MVYDAWSYDLDKDRAIRFLRDSNDPQLIKIADLLEVSIWKDDETIDNLRAELYGLALKVKD